MSKQVQIDGELFCDLVDYFLGEYQGAEWLANDIKTALNDKLDKVISRELFSRYKRSPSGAEREQARQAYLNHKGISEDWRSDTEIHFEPPMPDA